MRWGLGLLAISACAAAPQPASRSAPAPAPPGAMADVRATLAEISAARIEADVARLVAFGTRHTLSDTTSPTRGIGAARTWVHDELARTAAASGRQGDEAMQVSLDRYTLPADGARVPTSAEIVDVVAVLPGAMLEARARRYYVMGHLDSRASDVMNATIDAPGANDDASGVALVLEAARVMSRRRYDATVVFLVTVGEEQGLYGAKLHAEAARAAQIDVRAVLNDDIVGDPSTPGGGRDARHVRVFSEGLPTAGDPAEVRKLAAESDSPSRELARFVATTAHAYDLEVAPTLIFRPDRLLRGGDHLAFNAAGFPAVRFTTVDETYERQHQDVRVEGGVAYGDLPRFVDAGYVAGVTRDNVATLAHLARAPRPPGQARMVVADLGHDVLLRWTACPETDVAGYEVVWRRTTSPTWEQSRDVGPVTQARLPMSKDDWLFGLRAYDREGYRSPVTFAGAAKQ